MTKRRKKRRSRARDPNGLPKGAYRLPDGNYMTAPVTTTSARGRRISVRAVVRAEPDAKKVADVLLAIVTERAEAERRARDESVSTES